MSRKPQRAARRAPESAEPERRSSLALRAGVAVMAAFALVLAWIAFRLHPVGDYFTESDFYGAFAEGARGIQAGHFDFARYGITGPLYELALAASGAVLRDLFLAARVLSVASALVVMGATWWWARRRLGAAAAAWLVALLAVNPSFLRYGYSASTDMLSCAAFALALAFLLGARDARSACAGGAAAGIATLTRYNLASLLPGALIVWAARRPRALAVRGALAFAIVFAAVVAVYAIPAAHSGRLPGYALLRDAHFYLQDAPATAIEQRYLAPGDTAAAPAKPAPGALATPLLRRALAGLVTHARDEASRGLGWPVTALVLAGLAWTLATRTAAPLLALAPPWLAGVASLAPVFYSERYTLPLLPLELAPAALALGLLCARGGRWRAVALVAGAAALLASANTSLALQRLERESIPTEVMAAGRAIRAEARPGDRVLARKGHVAFEAGLEPVLFPEVHTLDALGAVCRERHVRYLYYSWYELRLRPQFGYLLDTLATVPGLVPICVTSDKPSVTYRVGAEFGRTPAWWADAGERAAIRERVNATIARALAATKP